MKPKEENESGFSIRGLSAELGKDRATIARLVAGITPVSGSGSRKRYRIGDVEAAMAAKPGKSLRDEKLGEEIRKLRIRNDKEERVTIPRNEVSQAVQKCLGPVATMLEQKLVNEYPAAVAGMDVPQARIFGRRLVDTILVAFTDLSAMFPI